MSQIKFSIIVVCLNPAEKLNQTLNSILCQSYDNYEVIVKDGGSIKFKKALEQVTYSGEYAAEAGQEALYVTERAVFKLTPKGIMLTEIAPGVDLQCDILDKMEFRPLIAEEVKEMDPRIFRDEKMGLTL